MAAVKVDLVASSSDDERRRREAVTFDALPADAAHGDQIVVWYRVSAGYRAKSGDWVGLFACADDADNDQCATGTYSYVSFQWAPKYPNIEKSIPRRRVVFSSDQIKVEPSDSVYYRFLYMTTSMEKVVGCSNRFRIRLMLALAPPSSRQPAVKKTRRTRVKAKKRQRSVGQADNDSQTSTTPATTTPTTTTTTTTTAATAAAAAAAGGGPGREDDSHVIDPSTTPPVSALMSEDDPTMTAPDPTELPESRDSGLSNQQQRHKVASNNAEYTVEQQRQEHQEDDHVARRCDDDDDDDDWVELIDAVIDVVRDLSVAAMTSLARPQSRDPMTSQQSRDAERSAVTEIVRSHLETRWSKSNTLTVADHHPADDCQRASTHKHLRHDDDDDDDDDSEAGGTHVTSSTQNHPKPPGVQNRTSSGSTACCRSNRAGRKRCRCYVTSSQQRSQRRQQQENDRVARRRSQDDDDDDDDWVDTMVDEFAAVMTSFARRRSRDRMTSHTQSRDVERLRDWLEEERGMRREMMTSQQLLQRTLVECLRAANQQLAAVTVHEGQSCPVKTGKTRCHRRTTAANACWSHGCCSECGRMPAGGAGVGCTAERTTSECSSDSTSSRRSKQSSSVTDHDSTTDADDNCHCCLLVEPTSTCCRLDGHRVKSRGCRVRGPCTSRAPVCCPLLSGQCPVLARMYCRHEGPMRAGCRAPLSCVCTTTCTERCPCAAAASPVPCCPLLAGQCPLVAGQCGVVCVRHSGKPAVCRCPSRSSRPSTSISSSTDAPPQSRRRRSVCACCRHDRPASPAPAPSRRTDQRPPSASPPQSTTGTLRPATEQSHWKSPAEKRRPTQRVAADGGGRPGGTETEQRSSLVVDKTESHHSATVVTSSTTTTPTTAGAGGGRSSATADQPRGATAASDGAERRVTGTGTAPGPAAGTQSSDEHDPSSTVIPRGDELRQLVDSIADIERDIRAMTAALQSTSSADTGESRQRHAVAGGPQNTAAAGRTAAVAILLPSIDLCVTSSDNTAQTTHAQSTHADGRAADRPTSAATQKPSKAVKPCTLAGGKPGRVAVLPLSTDNGKMDAVRPPDYTKYALVPPAASRLPFRPPATKHAAAAAAQTSDRKRQRTDVEETGTSADDVQRSAVKRASAQSEMSDRDSTTTTTPQFAGIQHIIQHLESISAASQTANYRHRPPSLGDASHAQTQTVPPAGALRHVGTSPLNCADIAAKQTQTSPKTSARLGDDKNTTVKSRSLESQQQQQRQQQVGNAAATSTVVTLPRSSAAVTTPTHSAAIALPAPASASPAGGTAATADAKDTQQESTASDGTSTGNAVEKTTADSNGQQP